MSAGTPTGARPPADLDWREDRKRIAVAPVDVKDLAHRGKPGSIWESVGDRESEHLTLPNKGKQLGFYFVR